MGAVLGVAATIALVGHASPQLADFQRLYAVHITLALLTALMCLRVDTRPTGDASRRGGANDLSTLKEQGMSNHHQQQDRPVAIVTGASGGIGEATARAWRGPETACSPRIARLRSRSPRVSSIWSAT